MTAKAGRGSRALITSMRRRREALVSRWCAVPPAMICVSVKCTKQKSAWAAVHSIARSFACCLRLAPEVARHHAPHKTPPAPRVYALYGTELQTRPAHVLHMPANPCQALLSHAQCSHSMPDQGHGQG